MPLGSTVTATASNEATGDTSEFSNAVVVVSPFVVTNTNDSGIGSLRQAIQTANREVGLNTITFAIPGAGVHTISPASALPTITDPVDINGFSQGGPGYTGPPLIDLNGANAGAGVNGLWIIAGSSMIQGLAINQFQWTPNPSFPGDFLGGHGILIQGNGGNTIRGNYIGTDATGTSALGNQQYGIAIQFSPDNTIGGTAVGSRNIISGNRIGIVVANAGATGNVLLGNYIGTDVTGNMALGNSQFGVAIDTLLVTSGPAASNNTIGGTTPEARNVISANGLEGIRIRARFGGGTGNVVLGNYIGTDASGSRTIDLSGRPLGNGGSGVLITDSATSNTIGGATDGARNVISGNAAGITIQFSASNNAVLGNFIGTNDSGANLGNTGAGVLIDNADHNTIGGANTIGHNGTGIDITGSARPATWCWATSSAPTPAVPTWATVRAWRSTTARRTTRSAGREPARAT